MFPCDWTIVTVAAGRMIENVNFGNTQPGSIHGKKYDDYNGNGQYDEEEIVIVGGVDDGFSAADGVELTNPRPGLAAEIGNPNPQTHYDATIGDRYFVETLSFATPASGAS